MNRIALVLACVAALAVSACGTLGQLVTGSPATVANQTKLDEQIGLTLTLAYTAAARAAGLAIETGVVKDRATITRIGQLDRRAYAAVTAVRAAYQAGNSTGYLSAISAARAAVTDLLAAVRGPVAEMRPPEPGPGLTRYAVMLQQLQRGMSAILLADYRLASTAGGHIA